MRYLMRQKLFSWGDDFVIKDENGRDCFFVDGKVFTLGQKLSFQDMGGRELLFISQRLLAWGPTYEISRGDELVATVRKELFTFLSCRFTLDQPGPNDFEATGDLLDHEYQFVSTMTGQPVAAVSKQWFTFADTYGVDVSEEVDHPLILAATVVIDMCCHGDKRR